MAGATLQEAEDAVGAALADIAQRWYEIDKPFAYARRAVLSNLIKEKINSRRLQQRLCERGHAVPEADPDTSMTVWEDQEWVDHLLGSLPPAQREVMAHIVEGLSRKEIAELLGKTEATVRQNLHHAVRKLRQHQDIVWPYPANGRRGEGQ